VSDSVVKAAKRVLNAGALQLIPGTEAEVELIFTDAAEIKTLNAENRNKDAVTDVLSFPELDLEPGQSPSEAAGLTDIWGGKLFLGSIVICDSRAKEQAAEFGHSEEREFAFLAAHSLLHLLGWDHERGPEEEKEMFALQEKILRSVGLTR
ncbi:MAG: rRNA maturation RNase YbeY, partial [Clostridia bacterium]|nr:rRNA maturation RNase YbeY [Clostridia bacterium]